VSDMLIYYDEQTPEKIAYAIRQAELSPNIEYRSEIMRLNNQFMYRIRDMLLLKEKK